MNSSYVWKIIKGFKNRWNYHETNNMYRLEAEYKDRNIIVELSFSWVYIDFPKLYIYFVRIYSICCRNTKHYANICRLKYVCKQILSHKVLFIKR